jgi:hypothetical protein
MGRKVQRFVGAGSTLHLPKAKMIEMENFMNNLIAADDSSTEEEPELSQAELEELAGNLSSD